MVSSNLLSRARRLFVAGAACALAAAVAVAVVRLLAHGGPFPLAVPFAIALAIAAAGLALLAFHTKNELALHISNAGFRSLFDANLIGIGFWSFDGRMIEANGELLRIFGVRPELLREWRWTSPDTPMAQAIDAEAVETLRRTGRCAPYEKACVRADGSRFWVHVVPAVIEGADRNIVFVTDVTESVEARLSLERAHQILLERVAKFEGAESEELVRERAQVEVLAERVAAATEELETFSYSVSHDLRAPLRAIDGFSRELALAYGDVLEERGRRYLDRILQNTKRMAQLIDDLLDLARLSRKPMRRTIVDVTALTREIAADRGAACVRIADGLRVNADPHLLRVVLVNLIGNAVKFSRQHAEPRVDVFAGGDGSIAVRDNGVGFDMEYAQKLFVPFQRLHSSSQFEGTGIGLALVHRIVKRHGGSIRVEAAPDRGATFFFTLGDRP